MFTVKVGLALCKKLPPPVTPVTMLLIVVIHLPPYRSPPHTLAAHLGLSSRDPCEANVQVARQHFSMFTAWLPVPTVYGVSRLDTR